MRLRTIRYLDNRISKKEKLYLLEANTDFINEVKKIKTDLEIEDANSYSEKEYTRLIESDALAVRIKRLLNKFNLQDSLEDVISNFIINGDMPNGNDMNPNGLWLVSEKNGSGPETHYLKLNADTSWHDIKRVWPQVKEHLNLKRKKKAWIEVERDRLIYTLHKLGYGAKEIVPVVKKRFGTILDEGNIWKIIFSFKKKSSKISKTYQ